MIDVSPRALATVPAVPMLGALCLALGLAGASLANEGDRRGFLAMSHPDGSRTVKAWIQIDRQHTLFYSVSLDRRGDVTQVCSEPAPIPESALTRPTVDLDTITTWTWTWLTAKGHGRLLVDFWDSPTGTELAGASVNGALPPACG